MRAPEGFVMRRRGRRRVMVRADVADMLAPWLLRETLERPADARPFEHGRGAAYRMRMGERRLVVRECRRGGWVARWVEAYYLGLRPRPFRELVVTAAARRRGIPTAEVLGARAAGVGAYSGALVTAEIEGAAPVLTALGDTEDEAIRAAIVCAAGRAVGTMHRLGLHHRDLNCTNLLVVDDPLEVRVIDLDRAALGARPLADWKRRAALGRLARSLRKLDGARRLVPPALEGAFRDGYEEAGGGRCEC